MNGRRDDWGHRRFEGSPTAERFCLQGRDFLSRASICCLEGNSEWKDSARRSRESYWMRRLNTLNPGGINKGDGPQIHLQSIYAGASCIVSDMQCSTLLLWRCV